MRDILFTFGIVNSVYSFVFIQGISFSFSLSRYKNKMDTPAGNYRCMRRQPLKSDENYTVNYNLEKRLTVRKINGTSNGPWLHFPAR